MNKGLFSSECQTWATPIALFKHYDDIYHFDLDVCANKHNRKVDKYFDVAIDGLAQPWAGSCWMNPPYGREIQKWMKKAIEEVAIGNAAVVVCLLPARTDTAWWHDYAMKGAIEFIRGRVRFEGGKYNAPFPTAIVIFEKGKIKPFAELDARSCELVFC